jgi:hypothetical protein
VPPGRWSWRAVLEEGPDAGLVLPRDTVRVAAAGPALSLSDLALGVRSASARWLPAAADTVFLTPFDLVPAGSEVELYYEGTGATPGATYGHRSPSCGCGATGAGGGTTVVTLGSRESRRRRDRATAPCSWEAQAGAYVVECG